MLFAFDCGGLEYTPPKTNVPCEIIISYRGVPSLTDTNSLLIYVAHTEGKQANASSLAERLGNLVWADVWSLSDLAGGSFFFNWMRNVCWLRESTDLLWVWYDTQWNRKEMPVVCKWHHRPFLNECVLSRSVMTAQCFQKKKTQELLYKSQPSSFYFWAFGLSNVANIETLGL